MPDYVIKTQFRGADKLSPILKRMGINVKQVGDKASRSFKKASRSASVFGGALKAILAAGVIRRGINVATMAVRGLAEEFLDFDKNITKAVTRLPGQLDRTSKEFVQLSKAARQEAAKTEFTAGQTAAAVEQLALAGFETNQVLSTLPGVLNLATNAGIEVADATRMATKSLGAFGLRTKDTAQLQKNLTRVNDVFSRAVSSASLDIEGMFETLKFAGPAMFAAGQSIETFAATTELLADRSIDASVAGTSLRRTFIQLAKKDTAKKLKRLGVEVADSSGNFRDFADILGDVGKATEKMGNQQKLATLTTLFGARAVNSINALLDAGSGELKKYRKRLEEAGGASKKMADTIRSSLTVRLQILRSTLIELGLKFVKAFTGKAGKGLDTLIEKIRKFDVKPVVQGIKDGIKFTLDFWKAIKPFRDNLPILIGLWLSYRAALIAVTSVQAVIFFIKLAAALKAAGKAQGILNILMAANPIGLIVVAVAALIFVIGLLIWKWKEVSIAVQEFIGNAHIGFIRLKMIIIGAFVDAINWIIKKFGALLEFFGVEVPEISLKLDFSDDLQKIKEIRRVQKEMIEEQHGLGIKRGAAGIAQTRRGFIASPTKELSAAQKEAAKAQLFENQRVAKLAVQKLFAEQPPMQAPNRSEVEAHRFLFEGKMSFEGAPQGSKFEGKTTGGKPVAVEGLGTQ